MLAVIRLSAPLPLAAARALAAGGIRAIELTLTTPGALKSIGELRRELPDCLIGAGTVSDGERARAALKAGAQFCVSPVYHASIRRICETRRVPYVPGAFTPGELLRAHEAGCGLLKLFPADTVGPGYLRAILQPLPFLRVVPSGGVSLANAAEWLAAGAAALSVGGALISDRGQEPAVLTERARRFVAAATAPAAP